MYIVFNKIIRMLNGFFNTLYNDEYKKMDLCIYYMYVKVP